MLIRIVPFPLSPALRNTETGSDNIQRAKLMTVTDIETKAILVGIG
jgi:hypothetical protein